MNSNDKELDDWVYLVRVRAQPTKGLQSVQASWQSDNSVLLSWSVPSYYQSFDHVIVYRSSDPNQLGRWVANNVRSAPFKDKFDIKAGTRYYYTLRAVTDQGYESTNTGAVIAEPLVKKTTATKAVKKTPVKTTATRK